MVEHTATAELRKFKVAQFSHRCSQATVYKQHNMHLSTFVERTRMGAIEHSESH